MSPKSSARLLQQVIRIVFIAILISLAGVAANGQAARHALGAGVSASESDAPLRSVESESPASRPDAAVASLPSLTSQPASESRAESAPEFSPAAEDSGGTQTQSKIVAATPTPTPVATPMPVATPVAEVTDTTEAKAPVCSRYVTADVIAFDQVYTYNRFGAFNPAGMIYALRRDVVPISGTTISAGNVQLRPDKRPRPIALRVNEGDCLRVTFQNLLTPTAAGVENKGFTNQPDVQPYTKPPAPVRLRKNDTTTTRTASMHVNGLDYVTGPDADDGAYVGNNASSLAPAGIGQTRLYTWYAAKQGQYLLYSMGAPSGNEGDIGQAGLGLFGSVNVEPKGAKWYRSQVTEKVLIEAAKRGADGMPVNNKNGTPQINYEATYTNGDPVLNMLKGTEIIYTDLNALITGFTEDCAGAPPSGTCGRPFREFTVVFHDELKAVQAFSKLDKETGEFSSPLDADVFHGVRDGFGINYGASGLGAILIANRLGAGPSVGCKNCKFEEFFLESWVNGDPAMVVKRDPTTGAGHALFPDDPSNVHHSYLNDPVRFRNLHIGKETHVFHLHAHQWLQSPRFEDSTYLDSQTISPGASYTYEINYGGSGNRNQTPGDAIFHCHLYPHFAQGMWELWRTHDVFETGGSDRNLPDAELGSSPNPGLVPLPNLALPPMPNEKFMGYPFYIAGVAGKRPPQPPLDFTIGTDGKPMDGGLPRHIVLDGKVVDGIAGISPTVLADPVADRVLNTASPDPDLDLGFTAETPLTAFARKLVSANVKVLPSGGTSEEQVAMKFHQGCFGQLCAGSYPSFTSSGTAANFVVNGLAPQPGAPFADPCDPAKFTRKREYSAAYIQFDMPVNRAKWHDRQARILTLADDAIATRDGQRAPEPLFFRANSGECVIFNATNLIPKDLNLDDFQVFTPTDIMGQHIHLVKFDVTASDGAANGWNYEDGTFSPGEVQERVEANKVYQDSIHGTQFFNLKTNTKFGSGPDLDGDGIGDYVGAQTTVQRWWADPLLNTRGNDRTIRTVFTHDHFGPSSHQHHGFYGALVVEKSTASWTALDGAALSGRADGGPTSFAANILDGANSFREFNLAFADFAIVYRPDLMPVNPPGREMTSLPIVIEPTKDPRPEAISAEDPGTQLLNYRNEPIPLRIRNPATGQQYPATDPRGELANVFSSTVHGDPFTPVLPAYEKDQAVVRLVQGAQEEQHVFNVHGYKWLFEPGTPGDAASVNNSGYRNGQQIGISEHFEFYLNQPPASVPTTTTRTDGTPTKENVAGRKFVDHLYSSAGTDNLWDGQWGILRVYNGSQSNSVRGTTSLQGKEAGMAVDPATEEPAEKLNVPDPSDPEGDKTIALARLPNNPAPVRQAEATTETPASDETAKSMAGAVDTTDKSISQTKPVCSTVQRTYNVTAILARDLVPGKQVVYNKRSSLFDPNAILLVNDDDLTALSTGAMQPEPLFLRANAGECVAVTLKNKLPEKMPENHSWNFMPMIVENFNFNQVRTSNRVGLHTQLVAVNTYTDDGARVGYNPDSTVGPNGSRTYTFYAGDRYVDRNDQVTLTPIEFGATGLRDMGDAVKHASHGSVGALLIEPSGSTWQTDAQTRASANIFASSGKLLFREFALIYQTDLSLQRPGNYYLATGLSPLENMHGEDDSEDSGMKAFNYRTEPLWGRLGVNITTPPIGGPDEPPGTPSLNDFDMTNILSSKASNPGCGGACGDPETPLFTVKAGSSVRFRVLDVAGHPRQHGFTIFGHHWNFEPWQNRSLVQGSNPKTFEIGSESGIGPTRHVNILTNAGGLFAQPGDYLYRTQESFNFTYGGLWGIFRVFR
jgi:hypothetical protein